MFWSFRNYSTKMHFWPNKSQNLSSFSLLSCVQPSLCEDNRNKTGVVQFAAEDILNSLISSAQNANCPDGDICCSRKFTKQGNLLS